MKNLLHLSLLLLFMNLAWTADAQNQAKEISLEDIYKKYKFYPEGIENLRSMNDGEYYTVLSEGKYINRYQYETGDFSGRIFSVTENETPFRNIDSYSFSKDEKLVMLTTNSEKIYRHSFRADYYIFNRETKELKPLSKNGMQQLATFSPQGNRVAFVRGNNLFVVDLENMEEKQITNDGEYNKIINGAPDWVYEEEFGFSKAFAWSPDGEKIAFYRFDESHVKMFRMTMYNDLYPDWYEFKYPKAGERNAIVKIKVYHTANGKTLDMDIGTETDQYIPRIKWTRDPEVLSIVRLNRLQNHMEILHSNAFTGTSQIVYEETEDKYISEVSDQMVTYLENGEEFIIISERDGWSSLYRYNFKKGEIIAITEPGYDIQTLMGIDEENGRVYYSSHENGPLYLDTWSIRLDGKRKKRLTEKNGWNSTLFSKGFKYYINTWSNINTPPVITLHNDQGKLIRTLKDNQELKQRMDRYDFSDVSFFSFETRDNVKLDGYRINPPDFDPNKKYPLFMFVYGGPESQNVADRFSSFRGAWFQMLAQKGYVVVCVDNRGTNARGEEFRKSTYMQLGKYETLDQADAAEYLGSLDYIDENRIGIFGWSYGGYMSLNCLFKAPELFRMAISVAPVTNWRYYDTIYTERFMRTPEENPDGYDDNSPIFFAEQMKGDLLLVHGMGDDNVHFQNSTEMIKALVKANKQFDSQFYPNKNHGIYGGNTTFHLYTRMTDFILEKL